MAAGETTYSADQVTKALLTLAANGGDAKVTAELLIEDEFQVSEATLLLWKHETYAERYSRMVKEVASDRERQTVSILQDTIVETSRIKRDMLAKVEKTADRPEHAGHALRAITDAESKSVSAVLALTGRPTDGRTDGAIAGFAQLLLGMEARGLINVASNVADGLRLEPQRVPNEAEQG